MDEVKFVLKGLVCAVAVTMLLQISVGGETLETKSDRLLHNSAVGVFLNHTAEGASVLMHRGTRLASGYVYGTSKKTETRHQRTSNEAADAESAGNE